jgi:hypothetical protein
MFNIQASLSSAHSGGAAILEGSSSSNALAKEFVHRAWQKASI